MNKRTCAIPECNKAHRARGLCGSHYNAAHQPNRHAKRLVECAWCGTKVLRHSGGGRKYGAACSDRCSRYLQYPYSKLPADHWALWFGKTSAWTAPNKAVITFIGCTCEWCGDSFLYKRVGNQAMPKRCGLKCNRGASKHKRGERSSWITVKRRRALYERDEWMCQLCSGPVDKTLHYLDDWAASLDHVIPRSKQLVPDHSDSNLRLAHRWCNSVLGDGTYYSEHELAA